MPCVFCRCQRPFFSALTAVSRAGFNGFFEMRAGIRFRIQSAGRGDSEANRIVPLLVLSLRNSRADAVTQMLQRELLVFR